MKDGSNATSKRITVLISGRGSNMQSIHQHCLNGSIEATLACVVSNNPQAIGLEYARQHGIATAVVDHREFSDRKAFDSALANTIDQHEPELIALAGFMRVLSSEFTDRYFGRLINIHPSLLPRHRGLNTHQKVIAEGNRWHGCSVHFVSAALDGGPLIARSIVPVLSDDTADTLSIKVLEREHMLYPKIISGCLRGEYICRNGSVFKNGNLLRYPLTFNA